MLDMELIRDVVVDELTDDGLGWSVEDDHRPDGAIAMVIRDELGDVVDLVMRRRAPGSDARAARSST